MRENLLYYKVFQSKQISVGDAQKHLSSAMEQIKNFTENVEYNEKISFKNI